MLASEAECCTPPGGWGGTCRETGEASKHFVPLGFWVSEAISSHRYSLFLFFNASIFLS